MIVVSRQVRRFGVLIVDRTCCYCRWGIGGHLSRRRGIDVGITRDSAAVGDTGCFGRFAQPEERKLGLLCRLLLITNCDDHCWLKDYDVQNVGE